MVDKNLEQLVRTHAAGTVLFRENERGQVMYVIRSGKVNIWKKISDSEISLAVLGPGEFFGEMALLEDLPRSAGATVVEEATLIEVGRDAFETLVRKNSEVAIRLLRRLSARLRDANRQVQTLMSRSGPARALTLLRTLADPPDAAGRRLLPRELGTEAIGARAGLAPQEAAQVQRTFERTGLLRTGPDGRVELGPETLLNEFLLYVEMQEQYDPLNVHALADLAGLPEEEAHRIVRRVLAARLAEAEKSSARSGNDYRTYLSLKQRFEYAED